MPAAIAPSGSSPGGAKPGRAGRAVLFTDSAGAARRTLFLDMAFSRDQEEQKARRDRRTGAESATASIAASESACPSGSRLR
jgi:hypothetical protein